MKKQVELLAPAGSYEGFIAAIQAGADAVYAGGALFGARAYAQNFTQEELLRTIDIAHLNQKKLYLTVNTLVKEEEMDSLYKYLKPFYEQGLDAVIVQDIGVLTLIKSEFPELTIHASTQMGLIGAQGAALLKELGASRIVTARELSLTEISHIHENVDIEIESFVHGALCYCYSGQCLFSSILGGRSGNRGRCAGPCRLPYDTLEQNRFINQKNEQYVLSPKDMCTIDIIPKLIEAGIHSFKIEGRMKRLEYTAGVTAIYRNYLDQYLNNPDKVYEVSKSDRKELLSLYTRGGLSTGYYEKKNGRDMLTLEKPGYESANEAKMEEIRLAYGTQRQLPLTGYAMFQKGRNALFTLQYGDYTITVEKDVVLQASKQPAREPDIKRILSQTGNTPFFLENLIVEMEEDVFLPVKTTKELRREALNKMEGLLLQPYRRASVEQKDYNEITENSYGQACELHVLAETKAGLEAALINPDVNIIYISHTLTEFAGVLENGTLQKYAAEIHRRGKQVFLAMPYIVRQHTIKKFEQLSQQLLNSLVDGCLIRNYESLHFLETIYFKGKIVPDACLYTFQKAAKAFWKEQGTPFVTAPIELNEQELKKRGVSDSVAIVYGYLPLMITAGCLTASLQGCSHKEKQLFLEDRYKTRFRVKNFCDSCYNIIYNSIPLSLLHEADRVLALHPKAVRLDIMMENKETAQEVIACFAAVYCNGQKKKYPFGEYTKGHFRRGVE